MSVRGFPHLMDISTNEAFELFISTQISWNFGAPGLAKISRFGRVGYVPGVFVGVVNLFINNLRLMLLL